MKAGEIYEAQSGIKYIAVDDSDLISACDACDCRQIRKDCIQSQCYDMSACEDNNIHYKKAAQ